MGDFIPHCLLYSAAGSKPADTTGCNPMLWKEGELKQGWFPKWQGMTSWQMWCKFGKCGVVSAYPKFMVISKFSGLKGLHTALAGYGT